MKGWDKESLRHSCAKKFGKAPPYRGKKNLGHKKEFKSKFRYGDVVRLDPQILTTDPYGHNWKDIGVVINEFEKADFVNDIGAYGSGVRVGQGDVLVQFKKGRKFGIYNEDDLIKQ